MYIDVANEPKKVSDPILPHLLVDSKSAYRAFPAMFSSAKIEEILVNLTFEEKVRHPTPRNTHRPFRVITEQLLTIYINRFLCWRAEVPGAPSRFHQRGFR